MGLYRVQSIQIMHLHWAVKSVNSTNIGLFRERLWVLQFGVLGSGLSFLQPKGSGV